MKKELEVMIMVVQKKQMNGEIEMEKKRVLEYPAYSEVVEPESMRAYLKENSYDIMMKGRRPVLRFTGKEPEEDDVFLLFDVEQGPGNGFIAVFTVSQGSYEKHHYLFQPAYDDFNERVEAYNKKHAV